MGGVGNLSHAFFNIFVTLFLRLFKVKFCFRARLGYKRYFLSYSFYSSNQWSIKGGRGKVPKKCHILFEWPIWQYIQQYCILLLWPLIQVWCAPHEPNVVCPNFVKLYSAKLHSDFCQLFTSILEGVVVGKTNS